MVSSKAAIDNVVTSRASTAERARQMLDADYGGTDYRTITENPDIDIVHICTPNHRHKDALVSALTHGKHIYCDKPLVAHWSEVNEIESALASSHSVTQMTFQNRFFPATILARRMVDQGAIGEVLGFRAAYLHGGSADPHAPLKWKLTAEAGGGVIADLASHVFDFVEYLVGPIAGLMASARVAYAERPVQHGSSTLARVDAEDSVHLLARLEAGAVGTLEATKIATGSEDELRCEIDGANGALRFNLMAPHYLDYYDATRGEGTASQVHGWTRIDAGQRYDAPATGFPSPKAAIGWLRAHVASLANFLQAVAQQHPADPDLRQGIRVQQLIHAARRSANEQRWIDCGSTGHCE